MCFGASENNPNLKGPFAKEYMENIKKCKLFIKIFIYIVT